MVSLGLREVPRWNYWSELPDPTRPHEAIENHSEVALAEALLFVEHERSECETAHFVGRPKLDSADSSRCPA